MRETWYVLESGDVANPADIVSDVKGRLFHKNGTAVAMRGDTPSSRGVDAEEQSALIGKKHVDEAVDLTPKVSREVTADKPKRTYKTR